MPYIPATICAIPTRQRCTAWNGSKLRAASIEARSADDDVFAKCRRSTRLAGVGFYFRIDRVTGGVFAA
jgi:hypothetical protein